jgi:hypothetical protein
MYLQWLTVMNRFLLYFFDDKKGLLNLPATEQLIDLVRYIHSYYTHSLQRWYLHSLPFFDVYLMVDNVTILDEDVGVDLGEGRVGVIRLHTRVNVASL